MDGRGIARERMGVTSSEGVVASHVQRLVDWKPPCLVEHRHPGGPLVRTANVVGNGLNSLDHFLITFTNVVDRGLHKIIKKQI